MSAMIGYVAPHELSPVALLLECAILAEQAGFDAVWASDHFHPWQDHQGHSGHAWLTLTALTQRTRTQLMGRGVTCLTFRNNPAIVAQAFATLGILAPGRVPLSRLIAKGFTHVFFHSPQEDQARFVEVYGREVLPLVQQAAARAGSSR